MILGRMISKDFCAFFDCLQIVLGERMKVFLNFSFLCALLALLSVQHTYAQSWFSSDDIDNINKNIKDKKKRLIADAPKRAAREEEERKAQEEEERKRVQEAEARNKQATEVRARDETRRKLLTDMSQLPQDLIDQSFREEMYKSLKDPLSAIIFPDAKIDVREESLCGLVNAKNSFGAYIGTKRYCVKLNIPPHLLK
jgi:hypothetical protein